MQYKEIFALKVVVAIICDACVLTWWARVRLHDHLRLFTSACRARVSEIGMVCTVSQETGEETRGEDERELTVSHHYIIITHFSEWAIPSRRAFSNFAWICGCEGNVGKVALFTSEKKDIW